ncbi:hypothetical protein VNO77_26824 [Canavalia gladiata]|uniref:Uncharacterized protein n=1 Tax=Canavalia gladiata TaxID=3824 RepID=A0AAN9KW31_CANGL
MERDEWRSVGIVIATTAKAIDSGAEEGDPDVNDVDLRITSVVEDLIKRFEAMKSDVSSRNMDSARVPSFRCPVSGACKHWVGRCDRGMKVLAVVVEDLLSCVL